MRDMMQQVSRRQVLMAVMGGILSLFILDIMINNDNKEGAYSSQALSHIHGAFVPSKRHCDPYDSYGWLHVNQSEPHSNRWIPFNEECRSPALVAALTRTVWKDQPVSEIPRNSPIVQATGSAYIDEPLAPNGLEWDDMEWLRGRTVLSFGDSVQRHMVYEFCSMLKGALATSIGSDNEYYPFDDSEVTTIGDKVGLQQPSPESGYFKPGLHVDDNYYFGHSSHDELDKVKREPRVEHGSFYCHIPQMDFMYVTVFNFGFDEFGFSAGEEHEVIGPYIFEDRIEQVAKPIIDRIQEKLGRYKRTPDLVFLASALWDNLRWMKEDIWSQVADPYDFIASDRLNWYRDRIASGITKAIEVFPDTPIRWVTNHFPIKDERPLGQVGGGTGGHRPTQALPRLWRMCQAGHAAMENVKQSPIGRRADIKVTTWGEKVLGTHAFQHDDIHPKLFPANYLFLDMMLYDLKQSVS